MLSNFSFVIFGVLNFGSKMILDFYKITLIFFLMNGVIFSQNDSITLFNVAIIGNVLSVSDYSGNILYEKQFQNPEDALLDFDGDGNDELLIVDSFSEKQVYYSAYLFNVTDTVYLIDSVYSGVYQPYFIYSEEINQMVLIAGYPELDSLNRVSDLDTVFSPINCFAFEGEKIYSVNEELYELFIAENDALISLIQQKMKRDCNGSKKMLPAICSVYINYLNASEKSLADKFLNEYYFCKDKQKIQTFLRELF